MITLDYKKDKSHRAEVKTLLSNFENLAILCNKARARRTFSRLITLDSKRNRIYLDTVAKILSKDGVKTMMRDIIIIPEFDGKEVKVHDGKKYISVKISLSNSGRRLGEFVETRKYVKHSKSGVGGSKGSRVKAR